ncbi:MAG TPA: hypothetical protein K8V35_01000 [Aliicoccus persicus]|uniref:Uncharacterized protein n=1 Tax=Aliicoccus persicus TaxID=930138 RepID=A0A921DWC3_9STAP|nr:hypothetical protein [Aliicoccus persicus]
MLIPKLPDTVSYKFRTFIFGLATVVSIIVAIVISNFMSDSIVQTIMWIVFSLFTVIFLSMTVYSGIKAHFINE